MPDPAPQNPTAVAAPEMAVAAPETLPPPFRPRPRLFAVLLVAFFVWAAFLLWLNLYGSG